LMSSLGDEDPRRFGSPKITRLKLYFDSLTGKLRTACCKMLMQNSPGQEIHHS
jgi:hypothetical protein